MQSIQAGFDILVLLAAIDGHIAREEMEVIRQYIEENFDGEFHIQNEISLLRSMSGQSKLDYFSEAADTIKADTDLPSREAMIRFSLELIQKDGVIHEKERALVALLGQHWGIDTLKMVQEFLDSQED